MKHLLFLSCFIFPRDLHSFPTRRSSDLGNSFMDAPFGTPSRFTIRVQQAYASSAFSAIPQRVFITGLAFRYDCQPGIICLAVDPQDGQINLSTTSRGLNALSPVFAENIGADEAIIVPRGPIPFTPLGGVFGFSTIIPL